MRTRSFSVLNLSSNHMALACGANRNGNIVLACKRMLWCAAGCISAQPCLFLCIHANTFLHDEQRSILFEETVVNLFFICFPHALTSYYLYYLVLMLYIPQMAFFSQHVLNLPLAHLCQDKIRHLKQGSSI